MAAKADTHHYQAGAHVRDKRIIKKKKERRRTKCKSALLWFNSSRSSSSGSRVLISSDISNKAAKACHSWSVTLARRSARCFRCRGAIQRWQWLISNKQTETKPVVKGVFFVFLSSSNLCSFKSSDVNILYRSLLYLLQFQVDSLILAGWYLFFFFLIWVACYKAILFNGKMKRVKWNSIEWLTNILSRVYNVTWKFLQSFEDVLSSWLNSDAYAHGWQTVTQQIIFLKPLTSWHRSTVKYSERGRILKMIGWIFRHVAPVCIGQLQPLLCMTRNDRTEKLPERRNRLSESMKLPALRELGLTERGRDAVWDHEDETGGHLTWISALRLCRLSAGRDRSPGSYKSYFSPVHPTPFWDLCLHAVRAVALLY